MSSTARSSGKYVCSLPSGRIVADFQKSLAIWWKSSRREFPWRRRRASLYHQIVSEVLLQRTKAETVAAFWPLFIARFPNWRSIAIASTEEIEQVLKPIGLSRQRAPRLKLLASIIAEKRGRFPRERSGIEALPGVGQYIANAIEMFTRGEARPLVDVNMARLLERFFGPRKLADIRYDPYLQELAHKVVRGRDPRQINWAILDFAAAICSASQPRCSICPIRLNCSFFKKNGIKEVPRW